jgi:hypothetical protein
MPAAVFEQAGLSRINETAYLSRDAGRKAASCDRNSRNADLEVRNIRDVGALNARGTAAGMFKLNSLMTSHLS